MSKSVIHGLIDIYVAPKQLFTTLQEKNGWSWLPFILLLVVNALGVWWFYHGMSSEWIVEQQLAMSAQDMSPAQMEEAREALGYIADMTGIIGAASVFLITPIMLALIALYTMLVGNPGQKRSYGNWYALAVWSNMPSILNMLGLMVLILLSSDPNMSLSTVNYLSINQLLLGLQPGNAWFAWAENLNLIYIWISALLAVGLHTWSGYSAIKSAILGFLPLLVIFSAWAVFI